MGHGAAHGARDAGLRWRLHDLPRVRAVGGSHRRHPARYGRPVRLPPHPQASLVGHLFKQF